MTPCVLVAFYIFAAGALTARIRRSVAGGGRSDFARQLAERNPAVQPQKRVRTSAPKGIRLAEGYVDRAKERPVHTEDERSERLKALEEALKSEEIDQTTFDTLRFQIAGGDLSSTHLVKGLDFKLLERIKKGEDVYREEKPAEVAGEADPESDAEPDEEIDDALERLEGDEVQAVVKAKTQKKGQLSTKLVPGKKRTRDQILAELKAAREAARAQAEASALGSRFKKIGAKQAPGSRVERDSKGRDVLIIIDEDGHEKRKVRKVAAKELSDERAAFVPDKTAEVLGMEVPEFYQRKQQQQAEEEAAKEENIFDDADSDYDPLAAVNSGSEDSESDGEVDDDGAKPTASVKKGAAETSQDMPPPLPPTAPQRPRNYFGTANPLEEESRKAPSLSDPAVLAALQKARKLNLVEKSEEEQKEAERQARLKKLIRSSNRDEQDMDMGFGTNRIEDEEDGDDDQIKLSAWGDEDGGEDGRGGKGKRKRGPKKRKGDGNNAADVLAVMERRKAESS